MQKRTSKNRKEDRQKPDFDHKIIDIRRVARVMAGGRRFSFRVSVVAGNRRGEVGVGTGKASDTASAIEKATRAAKKNLVKPRLTKDFSIPREIEAKYGSAKVFMQPSGAGRGLVAGSSVRTILDLAGIKNINAKIISRSKNKLNNARAALKALAELE